MSATDSSRERVIAASWVAFALANLAWMYGSGEEYTIPYHLIWVSFALVYGLYPWSRAATHVTFWLVTGATGYPIVVSAAAGDLAWSECSEIVLMGALVALLIWHVDRQRATRRRINELHEQERTRARNRELAARFGSHEVRTRLTVARGYAEVIRDDATSEATRADAMVVLSELDKASATATKLLTLVRVEAAAPRVPVHVDDLIEAVVRRWETTADRSWSVVSDVGFILADADRLEAALDCLIENAVKFTGTEDEIGVLAGLRDGDVVIEVHDTGSGMPASDLERVLEVFQTGSTAGERAGSGLGLAIVRAIVTARGGRLSVSSTVGVGSRFTMVVPIRGTYPTDLWTVSTSLPDQSFTEPTDLHVPALG